MNSLDWPTGFERMPAGERDSHPQGFRVSRSDAFDNVLAELRKLGARNVQQDTARSTNSVTDPIETLKR